jgi:hypothetical protein
MTLNKIKNFSQTRDAAAFASAIESRVEGGKLFAAPQFAKAPVLKASVAALA